VSKALALASAPLAHKVDLRRQLVRLSQRNLFEQPTKTKTTTTTTTTTQQSQQRFGYNSKREIGGKDEGGNGAAIGGDEEQEEEEDMGAVAQWVAFLTKVADEHPRKEFTTAAAAAASGSGPSRAEAKG
jgi:hypothetical protein